MSLPCLFEGILKHLGYAHLLLFSEARARYRSSDGSVVWTWYRSNGIDARRVVLAAVAVFHETME